MAGHTGEAFGVIADIGTDIPHAVAGPNTAQQRIGETIFIVATVPQHADPMSDTGKSRPADEGARNRLGFQDHDGVRSPAAEGTQFVGSGGNAHEAGVTGAINRRPPAAITGSIELQIAVHVATRTSFVERCRTKAVAQLLHQVPLPDLEQTAFEDIADAQIGDSIHRRDTTAAHHSSVGQHDGSVPQVDARFVAPGHGSQLHDGREFLAADSTVGRGIRPCEIKQGMIGKNGLKIGVFHDFIQRPVGTQRNRNRNRSVAPRIQPQQFQHIFAHATVRFIPVHANVHGFVKARRADIHVRNARSEHLADPVFIKQDCICRKPDTINVRFRADALHPTEEIRINKRVSNDRGQPDGTAPDLHEIGQRSLEDNVAHETGFALLELIRTENAVRITKIRELQMQFERAKCHAVQGGSDRAKTSHERSRLAGSNTRDLVQENRIEVRHCFKILAIGQCPCHLSTCVSKRSIIVGASPSLS